MKEYNCKNYTEQGGAVTHIGGQLVIDDGGTVSGFPFPVAENVEASTATTVAGLKDDFNALITALIAAGIMAPPET